ncbi:MAG: 4-(cytidine 5'-diphospho)-2-C-methyl-D-erythritol kinase [Verrucomicrobiota bacterium]
MQLDAPAKINLSLEIKGRRDDGFHEIETLMTPISLADRLTVERSDDARVAFVCDDPSVPSGEDNLVVRAARLFRETTKIRDGVRIGLEKKIPHGAGLGGGSSDAATTLLCLNKLFDAPLNQEELLRLGAEIGSDIPFFISQSPAICRGRGELVTPTELPAKLSLMLVKPQFGVPTPWAYARWRNSHELPQVEYAAQEISGLHFVNDLERPVFEKFIFLGQLKEWLRGQAEIGAALLSGSGSTVFAVLRDSADAEKLAERVREMFDPRLWTYVCASLTRRHSFADSRSHIPD